MKSELVRITQTLEVFAPGNEYFACAWLDELLLYLSGNVDFINDFLAREIPGVELVQPEGTYLAWLDFRELGLEVDALGELLSQRARVALNSGHWFGREGAGFARMSFACPRTVLEDALTRIARAVAEL